MSAASNRTAATGTQPQSGSPATIDIATAIPIARGIRALARKAAATLPRSSVAHGMALRRVRRPIDYMRYAEFTAVLSQLRIRPREHILDVSSPQWFSLYLASQHPDARFSYINIVESELAPFAEIAKALGLENIDHRMGDVRELDFPDRSLDHVLSISVLEHVFPEIGGDSRALDEMARVLRPGGDATITLPYKSESHIVYVDGPVYEREGSAHNFFAREYDAATFAALVDASRLKLEDEWFIGERQGFGAVDYYEWGPGASHRLHSAIIRNRILTQLVGQSLDGPLARRYLTVSRQPQERLVNVSARLRLA